MINTHEYVVFSNKKLVDNVYEMVISGDTSLIKKAGQFINIKIEGLFLRRPISVCDYNEEKITIIYKVVGIGTQKMSEMVKDQPLDILVGLGNGFTLNEKEHILLVGGGVGIPPLYKLAKELVKAHKEVSIIMGFNTKAEIFYEEEFKALNIKTIITTMDGSYGVKGMVSDAIGLVNYDYYYTCGPYLMLKSVYDNSECNGQLSFEERMGCGFGACMGCTCQTLYGNKRLCVDGPVLESEEVRWENK